MDSLIVLRKPLRKTQLEPKFIIPKKSKKAVPKVDPIPPNQDIEESNEPPISFVKLYKDLCMENSICATSRVHASSPTRVRKCMPAGVYVGPVSPHVDLASAVRVDVRPPLHFECPPGQLHTNTPASRTETSRSDTSLVTHYYRNAECSRVFTDVPPPPSSPQVEVLLELDYDTISKDSGFF